MTGSEEKQSNKIDIAQLFAILWNSLLNNPVLVMGLGLAPVIAGSGTLKVSAAIAIGEMIIVVCSFLPTYLLMKKIPKFLRYAVATVISALCFIPAGLVLQYSFDNIFELAGIYLPLIVINSIVSAGLEEAMRFTKWYQIFVFSFALSLGFGLTICSVGAIREMLAFGTIWGNSVNMAYPLPQLALPFGGFLVVGLMAAAFRGMKNKARKLRQLPDKRGK